MKRLFLISGLMFCLALGLGQPALAAEGEDAYKRACAGCHGPDGAKSAGGSQPIKGRSSAEVQKMMQGYKDGSYGGKQKKVMMNVVKRLSDDQIKELSDYIGTLQ